MVGNLEENQRRKATFIPVLTLIICVSGLMAISYTLMITDVTNEFDIITEDDVRLSLVDSEMNVIEKGGFARMANNGKGASKIFYTSSCVNGDPEQLSYHIWKQSLEFGSANLNISVPDNTVKYVKVWYELDWSADFNPAEEYGLDMRLNIANTDISISEGEYSEFIDISKIQNYKFTLTGEINEPVITKHKPETLVYAITLYIESY